MFKHFLFFIIPVCFSLNLYSESYSDHRLDDSLYWNGGSRLERSDSRLQSLPNLKIDGDESFRYGLDLYLPMSYRTQKGGLDEDLESGYLSNMLFSPEIYLAYIGKDFKSFLIIAPLVSYQEEKKLDRDIDRTLDAEMIMGLQFFQDRLYLQGGRGFQRLDRYGFLMNSFMNFIELGYKFNFKTGWTGIELLGGNWNERNDSLTPSHWNADRYNSHGISWKGNFFTNAFNWNIFSHRIIKKSVFPDINKSFVPGEDFVYHGMEIGINPDIFYMKFELGGIGMEGFQDRFIPSSFTFNETKKYQNSILYYGKIIFNPKIFTFELNGLYQTNSGWQSMKQESRFMGGQGSILLNLSSYRNSGRYSEERLESGGVYLGKDWDVFEDKKFKIGIFLNQAVSYFGRGNEAILQASMIDSENNFILLSSAYAMVDPQMSTGIIVEEIRRELPKKEYLRFFVTAGLRF